MRTLQANKPATMTKPELTRRGFLAAAGLGSLALLRGSGAETPPGAAQRPPNVVLIVADDLGYAELGVQGCTDIPTPNIDGIASRGVRFTNGYVSCPVCSPTRAGLLTGRYQQRFGHEFNPGPPTVANENFRLPADVRLFPEYMKASGYATGMFGKWHLGYVDGSQPPQRGFDEFYGFLGGSHPYKELGTGQKQAILRGTEPVDSITYTTDAFAAEAAAFVERHKDAPFFVYLPFNAVHMPLETLEKYSARFEAIPDTKRRTFAAMLSAMDDGVGTVLAKLRELGLEENTLVFFISDNGGPTEQTTSRNDPLRGRKGHVYEGGIRVPFLLQWPGHIPGGQVVEKPVISLDILPTALAAAGIQVPEGTALDGVSLLSLLRGETSSAPHESLFWRFGDQWAVRQGDWKLVRPPDAAAPQLYNLAADVAEVNDLAAESGDKVEQLKAAYDAWNTQLMAPRWPAGNARRQQKPAARKGKGKKRAKAKASK